MEEILTTSWYPFGLLFISVLLLGFVNDVAREKVKLTDPDAYKKIVSERALFFERGGVSPADIGSYLRFYKYLVGNKAKAIIGKRMWYFYRIFIPLELLALSWLFILTLLFIGNA